MAHTDEALAALAILEKYMSPDEGSAAWQEAVHAVLRPWDEQAAFRTMTGLCHIAVGFLETAARADDVTPQVYLATMRAELLQEQADGR